MSTYLEFLFEDLEPEQSERLIAELAEEGFEGFEEMEHILKAYVKKNKLDRHVFNELVFKFQLHFKESEISSQNWNVQWESNFEPVCVDDFAGIRAEFHPPFNNVKHEIIITPKMSFGTGHHATTALMIRAMREMDFRNKRVLDFGTGTGILSILASKLGAKEIIAIDNDDWSIQNAKENLQRNGIPNVSLIKAETAQLKNRVDIILANINKQVILDNMICFKNGLDRDNSLVLSGLLVTDEPDIMSVARNFSFRFCKRNEENNWISLRFTC